MTGRPEKLPEYVPPGAAKDPEAYWDELLRSDRQSEGDPVPGTDRARAPTNEKGEPAPHGDPPPGAEPNLVLPNSLFGDEGAPGTDSRSGPQAISLPAGMIA